MTEGEALARQIEAECYDLAALERELRKMNRELDADPYSPGTHYYAAKRRRLGVWPLKTVIKHYIRAVYTKTGGNLTETGALLGIGRDAVRDRLKR